MCDQSLEHARYAVLVARSKDPFGPFEDNVTGEGSNVILHGDEAWHAPGHNSVIRDDAGDDWLLYHAISDADARRAQQTRAGWTPRIMLLERIRYRGGWPRIANDEPSVAPLPGPLWRAP